MNVHIPAPGNFLRGYFSEIRYSFMSLKRHKYDMRKSQSTRVRWFSKMRELVPLRDGLPLTTIFTPINISYNACKFKRKNKELVRLTRMNTIEKQSTKNLQWTPTIAK